MADLISRQAAIDAIRRIGGQIVSMTTDGDETILVDKAEVQTALMMLPSAQPEQRWIPVSKRFPEKFEYVLVTIKHKNEKPKTSRARWTKARWIGSGQMTDVTAWMPLPEPYKEDDHGRKENIS